MKSCPMHCIQYKYGIVCGVWRPHFVILTPQICQIQYWVRHRKCRPSPVHGCKRNSIASILYGSRLTDRRSIFTTKMKQVTAIVPDSIKLVCFLNSCGSGGGANVGCKCRTILPNSPSRFAAAGAFNLGNDAVVCVVRCWQHVGATSCHAAKAAAEAAGPCARRGEGITNGNDHGRGVGRGSRWHGYIGSIGAGPPATKQWQWQRQKAMLAAIDATTGAASIAAIAIATPWPARSSARPSPLALMLLLGQHHCKWAALLKEHPPPDTRECCPFIMCW